MSEDEGNYSLWLALTLVMASLCLLFSLFGCSSIIRQELRSETQYRRDLAIRVETMDHKGRAVASGSTEREGMENLGAIVVKQGPSYRIKGQAVGKCDQLLWESCAQQHSIEARDDEFEITISAKSVCEEMFEIKCIEEKYGRDNGAFILIADPRFTLPMKLNCNGDDLHGPVVACHAKSGLIGQDLRFDVDALGSCREAGSDLKCGTIEGKSHSLSIPKLRQVWTFADLSNPQNRARLYMLPHQGIVINRERK